VRPVRPAWALGLALAALFLVSGCAGGTSLPQNPGTAGPANQAARPQSALAAQTTAQTEFGLLAGGDYGHAWDLWSDSAKQAISRADFITLNTACPVELGVPTKVVAARALSSTSVAVDWQRNAQTGTIRMTYAEGAWRFEPASGEYSGGLRALVAKRRAAQHCRKAS
jgi:hypothetical protein